MSADTSMNVREAYLAMYVFLNTTASLVDSDDLRALLVAMSLLADDSTADPAIWSDWMEAVAVVKRGDADEIARLRLSI